MLCKQTENYNTISELNKLEIAKTDCSTVTDTLYVNLIQFSHKIYEAEVL